MDKEHLIIVKIIECKKKRKLIEDHMGHLEGNISAYVSTLN
jgi:hypothetical protein